MRAVVLIAVVAVAFADFLPRFPDEPIEAHPDSLQQASIIKKLVGVFVAPCVASSWFQPGALGNYSTAVTMHYYQNSTFEVDSTEYAGDPTCNPSKALPFAHYNFKGIFLNRGVSPLGQSIMKGQWNITQTEWRLPGTIQGQSFANQLNRDCPCGDNNPWKADGSLRVIDPKTCSGKDTTTNFFCQLVFGKTFYATYKWTTQKDYVASPLSLDQQKGWTQVPKSSNRHKVLATGTVSPDDCTFSKWYLCKKPVSQAGEYCGGCAAGDDCDFCEGLECEGCVYRFMPPDNTDNLWDECCPCFYYYADQNEAPFMKVSC